MKRDIRRDDTRIIRRNEKHALINNPENHHNTIQHAKRVLKWFYASMSKISTYTWRYTLQARVLLMERIRNWIEIYFQNEKIKIRMIVISLNTRNTKTRFQ